jgi:hypothetical protein
VAYAAVERRREDTVSVMDEKAIGVVLWDGFTQLLQRPVCGGMRRDSDVWPCTWSLRINRQGHMVENLSCFYPIEIAQVKGILDRTIVSLPPT